VRQTLYAAASDLSSIFPALETFETRKRVSRHQTEMLRSQIGWANELQLNLKELENDNDQ
jgi:hypothetical protein